MFRHLGLHPGADIDAYAAAALDDTDLSHRAPTAGRRCTTSICSPNRSTAGTGFHDLIREHARALAAPMSPADGTGPAR